MLKIKAKIWMNVDFLNFNMDTTLLVFNEKKVLHKEKRTEN